VVMIQPIAKRIITIEEARRARYARYTRGGAESLTSGLPILTAAYYDLITAVDTLDFLHEGAIDLELRDEADSCRSAALAILRRLSAFKPDDATLMTRINGNEDLQTLQEEAGLDASRVDDALARHGL